MEYNLKPVYDYINGEDIEGYTIDELEDNFMFMKSVIMFSNDKNFYNLCSDNLKHNYEFIDFLISKFSYDFKFIDEVAHNYLNNCDNEEDSICIIVKMCNILKNNDSDLFAKYRLLFISKFLTEMVDIEAYKMQYPESHELGLGFVLFLDKFSSKGEVLKYYAISMINYIFDELNVNLGKELHQKYKNPNDIGKNGIVNYMIDFIRRYDEILADYACVHTDILSEFKQRIDVIKARWNNYKDREELSKYMLMFERVHEYMYNHEGESVIGEEGFLYYIGKELRIIDKLAFYSGLDRITYEEMNSHLEDDFVRLTLSDFKERRIYIDIKRIILETLFDKYEEKNGEIKIIKFKLSKKGE